MLAGSGRFVERHIQPLNLIPSAEMSFQWVQHSRRECVFSLFLPRKMVPRQAGFDNTCAEEAKRG